MKSAVVLVLSVLCTACASERDLWQAQENIIANDNRLAESLADQHREIAEGDADSVSLQLQALAQENAEVRRRAQEIAAQATSAQTIAADALRGVETYLGSLGGPLGGVIGETLSSIGQGIRDQDKRLIAVETRADASIKKVESIEQSLDERIESQLLAHGMTGEQVNELQNKLSTAQLVALLAVIGAGTGGGAFASKLGKSRSAPELEEVKRRLANVERNGLV
ncbi:MAG: hypothetical protein ACIARQ_15815 [Phycisphaerales bacterium JB061]